LDSDTSRPYIETIHGISIADYIFVGAGVGIQYYYGDIVKGEDDKWGTISLPLFANIKGSYPVTDNLKPYINISIGRNVVASSHLNEEDSDGSEYWSTKLKGGLFYDLGIGLQYKKLNFGIGLQHQNFKVEDVYHDYDWDEHDIETIKCACNALYIKLGFAF
jgi:hypothetical protein